MTTHPIQEPRSLCECYGDVRQQFDLWLNRLNVPKAEWAVKDVQDALDRLADFIPESQT